MASSVWVTSVPGSTWRRSFCSLFRKKIHLISATYKQLESATSQVPNVDTHYVYQGIISFWKYSKRCNWHQPFYWPRHFYMHVSRYLLTSIISSYKVLSMDVVLEIQCVSMKINFTKSDIFFLTYVSFSANKPHITRKLQFYRWFLPM